MIDAIITVAGVLIVIPIVLFIVTKITGAGKKRQPKRKRGKK